MSQIASFHLLHGAEREELSDGGCSGMVYLAILEYFERDLGIDCRREAPEKSKGLDSVLFRQPLALALIEAVKNGEQSAGEIALCLSADWMVPADLMEDGLNTFLHHLSLVKEDTALLYEIY